MQPVVEVSVSQTQPLNHCFDGELKLRRKKRGGREGEMREIRGEAVGVERYIKELCGMAATMVSWMIDLVPSSGSHVGCT